MTEEEAKTKWCPFVRQAQNGTIWSSNRWGDSRNPQPCRCIASECMAWRWRLEREEGATIDTPKRAPTTDGHFERDEGVGR